MLDLQLTKFYVVAIAITMALYAMRFMYRGESRLRSRIEGNPEIRIDGLLTKWLLGFLSDTLSGTQEEGASMTIGSCVAVRRACMTEIRKTGNPENRIKGFYVIWFSCSPYSNLPRSKEGGASMQIVTIGNLKGGTGKSTFAVNLAVAAVKRGIRTVIIDLDPQQSAGKWADQRKAEDPAVLSAQANRLQPALREAERLAAELIVMDTAAHDSDILKPAIDAANVVLIPCRPSGIELQHVLETTQLVAERRKPVAVILNAVPPRAHELDEASQFIERLKVPLAPPILSELRAYARAVTAAQGVSEYEPHGKAAQEIDAVLAWLAEHMEIRVSGKDGKQEKRKDRELDKKKSEQTDKRVA